MHCSSKLISSGLTAANWSRNQAARRTWLHKVPPPEQQVASERICDVFGAQKAKIQAVKKKMWRER